MICVVRWDVGLSLNSDREFARGAKLVPARVEVTGLNPQVIIQFAGNVALDHLGKPSTSLAST
jgi:hypothetical protein